MEERLFTIERKLEDFGQRLHELEKRISSLSSEKKEIDKLVGFSDQLNRDLEALDREVDAGLGRLEHMENLFSRYRVTDFFGGK